MILIFLHDDPAGRITENGSSALLRTAVFDSAGSIAVNGPSVLLRGTHGNSAGGIAVNMAFRSRTEYKSGYGKKDQYKFFHFTLPGKKNQSILYSKYSIFPEMQASSGIFKILQGKKCCAVLTAG